MEFPKRRSTCNQTFIDIKLEICHQKLKLGKSTPKTSARDENKKTRQWQVFLFSG
jgi:hypothetical protein